MTVLLFGLLMLVILFAGSALLGLVFSVQAEILRLMFISYTKTCF